MKGEIAEGLEGNHCLFTHDSYFIICVCNSCWKKLISYKTNPKSDTGIV